MKHATSPSLDRLLGRSSSANIAQLIFSAIRSWTCAFGPARLWQALWIAAIQLILLMSTAAYAVGNTAPTFIVGDGKVTTAIGSSAYGNSVAVQADNKILVAGSSDSKFALVRYNTDGSLDASFGSGGKVTTAIGYYVYGYSVAVQTDGKILVAGSSDSKFALVRHNPDGVLDTTFGSGGKVTTAIGSSASGQSVTVQTDGKILVAGTSDSQFALARYNTDGSLDTSFGTGGKVGSPSGRAYSIALQADGKILVGGEDIHSNFALVRYTTDGSLDAGFGSGGVVTTGIWRSYLGAGESVTVQADGKILLAGDNYGFTLVRFNADGNQDTSFGSGGSVTSFDSYSGGASVTVQADGKILVAGHSNSQFALARYTTDGSLDTRFGLPRNTLDATPSFTEGGAAVILDGTVSIYDAELSPSHYSGATVTLARHGGANPDDVFSAFTEGTVLSLSGSGVVIGTVSKNSGGTLSLLFNSNATQARVNQTLSSIRYANTSHTPPASVVIDWTFNDGNTGAQGSGGPLSTLGSITVTLIGANDPPTGTDSTVTIPTNSTYTLQASDFGFLDMEDGATLTAVRIDSLPASGSLRYSSALMSAGLDVAATELASGYLSFTPASNASGTNYASFRFRVKDSGGAYASSANTLTFTVAPLGTYFLPGAPNILAAAAGNGSATLSFTAPSSNGGAAISGYTATCTPSIGGTAVSATGSISPITLSGLIGGALYSCSVTATNSVGTGPASNTMNVTPTSRTALPGASPSRPSLALNSGTGKSQMVVRAASDQLWMGNFNTSGTFEGWNQVPGASPSPVAQAWHSGVSKMVMVARSASDQLYLGTFNLAGTFEGWNALPGASPSPVALAWHPILNKMYMVARAANDQLYLGTFNSAGSFEGWNALPGGSPSPVALAWHPTLNKMYMVARAANDQLYLGTFNSAGSFEGWNALPGGSPSPVALAWHPTLNKMYMVVRSGSDQLWSNTFDSAGTFGSWTQLNGASPTEPTLAAGQSILQLVVRSADDQLWSMLMQ